MIPGPTLILQCPECKKLLKMHTLASGNTFGAKMFSDDKVEAPHLPSLPVLSKCTTCDTIFWLEELVEIGSLSGDDTEKEEWEAADPAKFLSIDDLFRALTLDEVVAEKDDELYIRRSIWWAFNDRVRSGEKLHESAEDESRWRDNIHRLMALFDSEEDYGKICIAELHRNAGNFDECIKILASISSQDLSGIKKAIQKECQKRNTLVFEYQ